MKARKKIGILCGLLVLCVLVIVSLIGAEEASFVGTTISVIAWDTATARAVEKLLPEFEQETGMKVEFTIVSEPVLRQKVMADLAARTGAYDVFLLDCWEVPQYAKAGYLVPLNDLIENKKSAYFCEDFAPVFFDALKYDGKVWGLPYYGHVGILMYRKDLFEEKGISVPLNTDEMMDTAAKLTDKQKEIYGVAMRAVRGEDNPIISTSWTWVFGGEWLTEDMKPGVNSPEFVAGVKWFSDILRNYGPPDVSRYSWLEVQDIFVTGHCGMIFDASDFVGRIEDPNLSQIVGKIGYALAPAGPCCPTTERYPSHLFTAGMGINADSHNIDASWLFLQWVTSNKVQQESIHMANTGITSTSVLESEEFKSAYPDATPVMLEAMKLANSDYMPHIPEYPQLCDILGTQISRVVVGEIEAQEAMDIAYKEMYRVLEGAGYYK